jgi:hypothetical protein
MKKLARKGDQLTRGRIVRREIRRKVGFAQENPTQLNNHQKKLLLKADTIFATGKG